MNELATQSLRLLLRETAGAGWDAACKGVTREEVVAHAEKTADELLEKMQWPK